MFSLFRSPLYVFLISGQIPWKVACEKTEAGIMTSFDFKDRKGVLFSLFAVGAVGSEVANRNDFNKVIVECGRKLKKVVC